MHQQCYCMQSSLPDISSKAKSLASLECLSSSTATDHFWLSSGMEDEREEMRSMLGVGGALIEEMQIRNVKEIKEKWETKWKWKRTKNNPIWVAEE